MPNHCFNQVVIQSSQDDIDRIMEHLRGGNSMFDFNTLVPMPAAVQDMNLIHVGNQEYFYSLSKWRTHYRGIVDPNFDFPDRDWVAENAVDEFTVRRLTEEYGTPYWYDWSCTNWGTKWNAYDVEYFTGPIDKATPIQNGKQITYKLTTAWTEPKPIMQALMRYLSQPGFHQDLEMVWRFKDDVENFDGEISNKDEDPWDY